MDETSASSYAVAGLSIQKRALLEQMERVRRSDGFAAMLLMGKIKAVQRRIDAALSQAIGNKESGDDR